MPKVSPQYKESRRQGIIEAARGAYAEQGFAGTSTADLVSASGLSMGALYRCSPSKAGLVLAMAEGRDGGIEGAYESNELPGELPSRVLTCVAPNASGVSHARPTAQIWGDAAADPGFAAKARERHSALRDQLARYLRASEESPRPSTKQSAEDDSRHPNECVPAEVLPAALTGCAALTATESPVDTDAFEHTLLHLRSAAS